MYDENKENLISIIVPIYKVEKYLSRCINSIVNQTYKEIEILLIDDGSPDRCPQICDEWAKKDKRIRVIHKQNGGLSDARNIGIEASTGEWIMFIDSDDYIDLFMCEKLLKTAKSSNADIVVCNFIIAYPDNQKMNKFLISSFPQTYTPKEMVIKYFTRCVNPAVWNRIYRRYLFFLPERIRFPYGRLHEDAFITYQLFYYSKSTTVINDYLYYYWQRKGSICNDLKPKNIEDSLAFVSEYIKWSKTHIPDLLPVTYYAKGRLYLDLFFMCHTNKLLDIDGKYRKTIKKYFIENMWNLYNNPYASRKERLKFFLMGVGILLPVVKVYKMVKKYIGDIIC